MQWTSQTLGCMMAPSLLHLAQKVSHGLSTRKSSPFQPPSSPGCTCSVRARLPVAKQLKSWPSTRLMSRVTPLTLQMAPATTENPSLLAIASSSSTMLHWTSRRMMVPQLLQPPSLPLLPFPSSASDLTGLQSTFCILSLVTSRVIEA